jgi:hypothetical protein
MIMRNRAKCKLCDSMIESFMATDYVSCTCGEITIGGHLYARATNFDNFLRIDDDDNQIEVKYKDKDDKQDTKINEQESAHKPTRDELFRMLEDMIKSYEQLPQQAMLAPISHADHISLLMLVSSLFKSI